mmetsp:Transcript_24242/g.21526  ORF Transcript_24242/g.21526 Transcript_24242/m.21526 type:complete len:258 (+) Transcript_24242:149-922(+)
MKAPDTLTKLKEKELFNAKKQLSMCQKENGVLKMKLKSCKNTKETVAELSNKLKNLEEGNDHLVKEINKLKINQNNRAKNLINANSSSPAQNSSMNVKLPNLENKINLKSKIEIKKNPEVNKSTTAKAQFERMLLLDHKYRELKGNLEKGNTEKLREELKIPITTKSLSRLNARTETTEREEIKKANYKLQKAKDIEIKRRKVLKQTFSHKINELKNRVHSLEFENKGKDEELEEINTQIEQAQIKLKGILKDNLRK